MDKERRKFLKVGGLGLVGGFVAPEIASAKRLSKEVVRRTFEPELDSLTKKIVHIESNWRYWEVSKDGAIGLMQVKPIVVKEWNEHGPGRIYGKHDLFDPYVNLKIGRWYLHERIGKHYLPHYELKASDENKAASYNAGPVCIGDIGDATENFRKLPKETRNYLRKLRKLS